jgi:hypothetical protein
MYKLKITSAKGNIELGVSSFEQIVSEENVRLIIETANKDSKMPLLVGEKGEVVIGTLRYMWVKVEDTK